MTDQSRYRRMSEDETTRLIKARIENDHLFKQKFYRRNENWTIIRDKANLKDFTAEHLRVKWNNLYKQYKELVNPPTGVQTETGEVTAANWEYFSLMHSYASSRHEIHPALVWHSQRGAYVKNPENSFTGSSEISPPSPATPVKSEFISNSESGTSEAREPGSSRQLARNYNREQSSQTKSRKRCLQESIFKKYKKECRRHKKETKHFFNFLEDFSNFIGMPYKPPSDSESEYSED